MHQWMVGVIGISAAALSGCAAIVHGPLEDVYVTSSPPGATAVIAPSVSERGPLFRDQQKYTVTTPATVRLKRDTSYRVEFSKPGYAIATTQIVSHWDWLWAIGRCNLCEAVGQLPSLNLDDRPLPIQFLGSVFYEYPRGFLGAIGKATRILALEGWVGTAFKLQAKDSGFGSNWHGLATPEISATLEPK